LTEEEEEGGGFVKTKPEGRAWLQVDPEEEEEDV
jgi:hypothetical protein